MSESEKFEPSQYFEKAALTYGVSRCSYVSCRLCTDPLTEEKQEELRKTSSEPAAKLEAARRFGLIPGQKPQQLKHLLSCAKADAELRSKALLWQNEARNRKNQLQTRKRARTDSAQVSTTAGGSAVQSAPSTSGNRSTATPSPIPDERPKKKRKTGGDLAQTRMQSYSSVCTCGKRLEYDFIMFRQLLVELAATHPNVSFNMFESVEWKTLVSFLCHGESVAKNSKLLPTAKTLRDRALKSRYEMAIASVSDSMAKSALTSDRFTVVSDAWTSKRKNNYEAYIATRPGCLPLTFGLLPIASDELTGMDIAAEWEILLLSAKDPNAELPAGYFLNLNREIDCMTSDSAGPNQRARSIIALRHPTTIQLACFAHIAALDCADLIKLPLAVSVVPDSLHLVTFYNASSSKWLPYLRQAMVQTSETKRAFALVACVVTRWTTVWLSAVSVLRAMPAFRLLVASRPNTVKKVLNSRDKRFASLKRCFTTIQSLEFETNLVKFLHLLVPTIESSLLLQGRKATLGDVVFLKIRQLQILLKHEPSGVAALEERWSIVEQPLLLLAFCFTPRYRRFAVRMGLDEFSLESFAVGYAKRWGSFEKIDCAGAKNVVSLSATVGAWFSGKSRWSEARHVDNYSGQSGDFWSQVARSEQKGSGTSTSSVEVLVLCEVLRKIFSCCPNSADAERLFSELGRVVTADKTRQNDETVTMKSVIAADMRMRRAATDGVGRTKTEQRRFMDTNALISRLKAVSDDAREGEGEIVGAGDELVLDLQNLDDCDAVEGSQTLVVTPAVADTPDVIALEAEKRASDMSVEDILGGNHEGNITVNSVLSDTVEDASSSEVAATELAINDYDALVRQVHETAAELGWDKEFVSGELSASLSATRESELEAEAEEQAQRKLSLDKHPLGQIPKGSSLGIDNPRTLTRDRSDDLPRDKLWGFRGFKISLANFANSVELPPLTRIGRFENDTTS